MTKPADETGPFFAMTGMPRSGTTYLAALLHRPPDVATFSEAQGAWKDLQERGFTRERFLETVAGFRRKLRAGEPVPTLEGTAGFAGRGRVDTWNNRKNVAVVRVRDDALLGVKNPEVFLEWLPELVAMGVRTIVTTRNPLGTIQSWKRKGAERVAKGRPIAGHFANGDSPAWCASSADPVQRRIELHEHWAALLGAHAANPLVLVVRYEDWFTRGAEQLETVRRFLGLPFALTLDPPPIPPDPIDLPPDEAEAISARTSAPRPPAAGTSGGASADRPRSP